MLANAAEEEANLRDSSVATQYTSKINSPQLNSDDTFGEIAKTISCVDVQLGKDLETSTGNSGAPPAGTNMDRDADPGGHLEEELLMSADLEAMAKLDPVETPPCWCCKSTFCDFQSEHPFSLRLLEQTSACCMWWSGLYVDNQGKTPFKRWKWETVEALNSSWPIRKQFARKGVYSSDYKIPNADGGKMKARVYLHTGSLGQFALRPVMLFFHGGGFCISHHSTKNFDELCVRFAQQGIVVVSIDYRLAPEHPFPAGVRDAYAGLRWIMSDEGRSVLGRDCDPVNKLILSGDSAGGTFALVIASLLRDGIDADFQPSELSNLRARHLALMYPALLFTPGEPFEERPKTDYFLIPPILQFFVSAYVPADLESRKQALLDRRISPLVAGEHGLPRCTVVVASDDALRKGCEIFVRRLEEANIPVKTIHGNSVHGFVTFHFLHEAVRCQKEVFKDLEYLVNESSATTSSQVHLELAQQ